MLGKIISPEQSITKANDFLNLRLKMWMNYCVVAADNLLEGRTGVAKQTQSKLPSMIASTTSEQ
jgi:hypothetical protein